MLLVRGRIQKEGGVRSGMRRGIGGGGGGVMRGGRIKGEGIRGGGMRGGMRGGMGDARGTNYYSWLSLLFNILICLNAKICAIPFTLNLTLPLIPLCSHPYPTLIPP